MQRREGAKSLVLLKPRTGVTPMTGVRIPAELGAKLRAWIERQLGPRPSRAEAIRRLIEKGLAVEHGNK